MENDKEDLKMGDGTPNFMNHNGGLLNSSDVENNAI